MITTCPADGLWPETVHSTENLAIPCPIGYSGTMYRSCSVLGEWSEVNDQYCGRCACGVLHSAKAVSAGRCVATHSLLDDGAASLSCWIHGVDRSTLRRRCVGGSGVQLW